MKFSKGFLVGNIKDNIIPMEAFQMWSVIMG